MPRGQAKLPSAFDHQCWFLMWYHSYQPWDWVQHKWQLKNLQVKQQKCLFSNQSLMLWTSPWPRTPLQSSLARMSVLVESSGSKFQSLKSEYDWAKVDSVFTLIHRWTISNLKQVIVKTFSFLVSKQSLKRTFGSAVIASAKPI